MSKQSFNQDQAYRFFSSTYKSSSSEVFHQPSWMLDTPAPSTLFYHGSITHEELAFTLKKCRCGSAPNPLDGISYTILKRCPSLRPTLLHLYNTCIMQSQVPSQWKAAVIKLIHSSTIKSTITEVCKDATTQVTAPLLLCPVLLMKGGIPRKGLIAHWQNSQVMFVSDYRG
jgi:hypothetical protein